MKHTDLHPEDRALAEHVISLWSAVDLHSFTGPRIDEARPLITSIAWCTGSFELRVELHWKDEWYDVVVVEAERESAKRLIEVFCAEERVPNTDAIVKRRRKLVRKRGSLSISEKVGADHEDFVTLVQLANDTIVCLGAGIDTPTKQRRGFLGWLRGK